MELEICIPTYKNRKNNLTTRLSPFSKDRKIHIFSYEDDDSYEDKTNFVIVPKEYHTVQKMRKFIQEYMGDKLYWVIDDDVIVDEESLLVAEQLINDFAIVGLQNEYYIPVQCVLFNGKILNDKNIKYTGDSSVHEDIEILYNASKAGLEIAMVDAKFSIMENYSTINQNKMDLYKNTLRKYPDYKSELFG